MAVEYADDACVTRFLLAWFAVLLPIYGCVLPLPHCGLNSLRAQQACNSFAATAAKMPGTSQINSNCHHSTRSYLPPCSRHLLCV